MGSREVCICSAGGTNQEETMPECTCVSTPSIWLLQPTPLSKLNVGVDLWPAGIFVSFKATLEMSPKNGLEQLQPCHVRTCDFKRLCWLLRGSRCPWHLHLTNAWLSGNRWCLVCLMARDYVSTVKSGQPFLRSHASLWRKIGFWKGFMLWGISIHPGRIKM